MTKGIHLVYRGEFSKQAILIPTKEDGRIFFIIPFKGNALIGTTDTDYDQNPDEVSVEDEDIEYLFTEANRVFPDHNFVRDDIIASFAGLRPLVKKEGSPSKLSRKHLIERSYTGIIFVMGGKYTTYRKIAEDTMIRILRDKPVDTKNHYPLYGSGEIEASSSQSAQNYDIEEEIVESLMKFYGTRYKDVLDLTLKNTHLKKRICSCCLVIRAQIEYSIETEMARKDEDIISRRLSLEYNDCQSKKCLRQVRKMMK